MTLLRRLSPIRELLPVPQYDLQVAVGTFSKKRIVDEVVDGKAIIDPYEYDWMEFNDTF